MTNKERQAKLQYLLNSLSMTKEQKDIVVDLVNSSGNGGGSGVNIKTIYMNILGGAISSSYNLSIDDITTDFQYPDTDGIIQIISPEFVNTITDYIDKGYIFNFSKDGSTIICMPIVTSSGSDIKMVVINLQSIVGEHMIFVIMDN